jgi:protein TonB
MFETLVVSQTDVRPNGRAGFVALILHFLLLALALQPRSEPPEGKPRRAEPIPVVFRRVLPLIANAGIAPPARVAPFRAPSLSAPSIPAIPSLASPPPAAPLDVAGLVGPPRDGPSAPVGLAGLEPSAALSEADEVDRLPVPIVPIDPAYPTALRTAGVAGSIVVEYVVGVDGRVDSSSVQVIRTSHPGFIAPVRVALAGARFTPAQRAGTAVAARVRQRIVFELSW